MNVISNIVSSILVKVSDDLNSYISTNQLRKGQEDFRNGLKGFMGIDMQIDISLGGHKCECALEQPNSKWAIHDIVWWGPEVKQYEQETTMVMVSASLPQYSITMVFTQHCNCTWILVVMVSWSKHVIVGSKHKAHRERVNMHHYIFSLEMVIMHH